MTAPTVLAKHLAARGHGVLRANIWTYATPSEGLVVFPALVVAPYNGATIETFDSNEQQPLLQVYITGEQNQIDATAQFADEVWETIANDSMDLSYDGETWSTTRCTTVVLQLGLTADRRAMFSINVEMTK